ncbi:MAG TPA: PDZ domain-containing protein [Candidatus Krumholzibacteria bacterium]|nr:PDZ domain-containing protein [Candidatus Krumholzibacteria bacterium]
MRTPRILACASLCLSLLTPVGARATITPEAQKVLDRYVEASGGRDAWEKTRVMHFSGTLSAYGLSGTIEGWRKSPDKQASIVSIGPLTMRDWVDGDSSTRTDPSGKLVRLDGKDLQDAISGAWFDNDRWLEPDQGGGSVALSGEITDSLGTLTVLDVQAPAGRKAQLQFDKKTGLIVRSIVKHDQVSVVVTNSDFRVMNGWKMAFKTVQTVPGMAANTATVQIEHVDFPADIPDDQFLPPAVAGASGVTWLKQDGSARLPFEYIGRHVWLRVAVDGHAPANFVFDTGASLSVIDSTYAASIGLKTEGSMQAMGGASSKGRASFATVDSLRVAASDGDGIEVHGLKVAVVSLNPLLAPFFWRDCAGIVGFDVISQFVTRLDYDGHQLFFFDPKTFKYDGKGTALAMTLAGNVPVVDIKVDGAYEGGARVDVGSDALLDLHTPFVKKNDLIAKAKKSITTTAGGVGGLFHSQLARMQSVEVGPYTIDDPLIGLSTTEQGALASEDYAGNIGNRLLERFTVTLDYERRQIWLEPGAHYSEHANYSRLGARFAKMGDNVIATQIIAGSAAEKAGLREGDVVTEIDGQAAASLDHDRLERQFEEGKPGTKVNITVMRDGKPRKLTAKLRDLL